MFNEHVGTNRCDVTCRCPLAAPVCTTPAALGSSPESILEPNTELISESIANCVTTTYWSLRSTALWYVAARATNYSIVERIHQCVVAIQLANGSEIGS